MAEIALPARWKDNPVVLHIPLDERPHLSFAARFDGVSNVFAAVTANNISLREKGRYSRWNFASAAFRQLRIVHIGLVDNPGRLSANRENAGLIRPFHLVEKPGQAITDHAVPWKSMPPTAENLL